jgi:predicted Holliday junction resolvase-like endonuclease
MTSSIISAVIAGVVAILVSWLTSARDTRNQTAQLRHEIELQEQRLRTELRTEFMAEEAINQLLRKAEPKRSFERIKARLGDGFSDVELKKMLVRAGALRYVQQDTGDELWGLRDRNEV